MRSLWILLAAWMIISTTACKGDSSNASEKISSEIPVSEQLSELNSKIKEADTSEDKVKFLQQAYDLAKASDKEGAAVSYAVALAKSNINHKEMLLYVAEQMNKRGDKAAAQLMLHGVLDRYPNDQVAKQAKSILSEPIEDKEAYVQEIATSVFENPDKFGINTTNARKYVDVCEAYALAYPDDKASPSYLYKASEIAVAIRTYTKALNLYDWLIDRYPSYEKTPNALFAKGYLLDEQLKKRDQAKATFSQFIEAYPQHDLADDAKFLLENIGKSGDEIIKIIEEAREKQEQ